MNPAVVAYCLCSVLFTVDTKKRTTGINPTRLAATLLMSWCLCCGAEHRGEEREREEGTDSSTARAAAFAAVIPGESLAVNACQQPPGPAVPGSVLRYTGRCSKRTCPARFLHLAA